MDPRSCLLQKWFFTTMPMKCRRLFDFKAKWEEGSFEYENTVREFPGSKLDPVLKEKIDAGSFKLLECFRTKRICKSRHEG